MRDGVEISIAVMGVGSMPLPIGLQEFGITWEMRDQYWRVRWLDDGEEIDHEYLFSDIEGMKRIARFYLTSEPVIWRYYETGLDP